MPLNPDASEERPVPWAAGRQPLYGFLRQHENDLRAGQVHLALPTEAIAGVPALPFHELVRRADVFAAYVTPAVDHLDGTTVLAPVLDALLETVVRDADVEASVRLYQIILSDWRWHAGTLDELAARLRGGPLLDELATYEFALWLLTQAPDEWPVCFALWLLRYTHRAPPQAVVRAFGLHDRFTGAACATIAARWPDSEDALIEIARLHRGWGRIHALDHLRHVARPEHRSWLLREGYTNSVLPIYTVHAAAMHGDLVGRLRADLVPLGDLVHAGAILDELTQMGGPSSVPGLGEYGHGPEACRRFIVHVVSKTPDERLFWNVARIVEWTEYEHADEDTPAWTAESRAEVAALGRACLGDPGWPRGLVERWLEQSRASVPTLESLSEGDLSRFHEIVAAAVEADEVEPVAAWATTLLCLRATSAERAAARAELEAIEMPGVRAGGVRGLTDPRLGSIYGQVVLQVLLALRGSPGVGASLIRAALDSDIPFHRQVAAGVLGNWPPPVPPDMLDALVAAHEATDDADARNAIEATLERLAR